MDCIARYCMLMVRLKYLLHKCTAKVPTDVALIMTSSIFLKCYVLFPFFSFEKDVYLNIYHWTISRLVTTMYL